MSDICSFEKKNRNTFDAKRLNYHHFSDIGNFVTAHLSHIQSQERTQQNREMEQSLRRRKELGEQQLAQKVCSICGGHYFCTSFNTNVG